MHNAVPNESCTLNRALCILCSQFLYSQRLQRLLSGPGVPGLRVMFVFEDLEPSGQGMRVILRGDVMLMLDSQTPHCLIQEGNQPVL